MLESPYVKTLIALALSEDLAEGDITSSLTIEPEMTARGVIKAKEALVVCGLPLLEQIASSFEASVEISLKAEEGDCVAAGTELACLSGTACELLSLERTMLNFLQRLSGIASYTRAVVAELTRLQVLDTRKTTPGWRVLEKYAVKVGGGTNHRMSLGDMILLKNNHVDVCGGMTPALERIYGTKPDKIAVEVEVRNFAELQEAVAFCPEYIMLDNMSDDDVSRCVEFIRSHSPQTRIEVSGGVQPERLPVLESLGVDCASMSALVGKAHTVDISMSLEIRREHDR